MKSKSTTGSKKSDAAPGSAVEQSSKFLNENTEETVVRLAEVLTVNQAVDFKKELDTLLKNSPRSICLDTSGIRSVDSAALQLILAFLEELKARKVAVRLQAGSDQLLELARTLGLLKVLDPKGVLA